MKRILCSDWLPERVRWAQLARLGCPALVPPEKVQSFIGQVCLVKMAGMGRGEKRANIQLVQTVKCGAIMESGGKKEEEGERKTGNKFPWPHPTVPLFSPLCLFFAHAHPI